MSAKPKTGATDSIRAETRAALLAMAEEAKEMQEAAGGSVTDAVAGWLAPRYAQAAKAQLEGLEGPERLELLRTLAQDLALLRKGDHSAARLRREQEWLELEREKTEERMRKRFEEWAKDPANLERVRGKTLSLEERQQRIRDIFGVPKLPSGGISPETRTEIERAPSGGESCDPT